LPDLQTQVNHGMNPAAEIDGRDGECFIHRHHEVSGSVDATPIAERGRDGLTERDADVFYGVMLIDIEVAVCGKLEIEAAVPCEQLEHVIEKPDAGVDVVTSFAIERQLERDLSLGRHTCDAALSHTSHSSAVTNLRVCSTTPAVMRKQSTHPGSLERSRT